VDPLNKAISYLSELGMARALRHRDYAMFAVVGWFSATGLWVQRIAVAWLTWELTHSGFWLGAMAIGEAVPTITLVPFAGAIADRIDRLRMAQLVQVYAVCVTSVLAVLVISGTINIYILFGLIMLSGATEAFWTPVRMTVVPSLVPKEDLSAALGISGVMFNLAAFIGPALSGLIIATIGVGWAFAFNAVSFLGYLVVLFRIRLLSQENRLTKKQGIFTEMAEGIVYAFKHPGIGPILPLMMSAAIFLRSYRELLAAFDAVFGRGAEGLAWLAAATGLGAIISSFYVGNFVRVRGMTNVVYAVQFVAIIALTGLAATNWFWLAVACSAMMGFCLTASGIGGQILIQSAVRGDMRGRVMSLWGLVLRGGPALGALVIGSVSTHWGLHVPLIGSAVIFLVVWTFMLRFRGVMASSLEVTPGEITRGETKN
jgi:MFS family permease